jgi:MFS family permease
MRWIAFGLAVAAFFLSFFHRVAPAAIASDLTAAFNVTGAALGALAATYFYVYAAIQLPTGVLADTLGPRKVLAAGGFAAGIGSLVFASADSAAGAAFGRTLVGLGVGVAFVCAMKINANWFEDRRFATATACANVVGILGAFAAAAPLAWLAARMSWRVVFATLGVLSILIAVLTLWKMQDAPPARARARPSARYPDRRWYHALAAVVRNRATWPAFWVNFGLSGTNMSFIGLWAVPFLTETYGMSTVRASNHTSLILAGYACSSIAVGWLSDRVQRRKPIMLVFATAYLSCWIAWIAGVPPAWTLFVAAAMGVALAGFSLSWACAKEVNAPAYAGMATSLANLGGFVSAGILQPLVGWILDIARSSGRTPAAAFDMALGVFALFACIGLAGALFIRETRCRNISAGD